MHEKFEEILKTILIFAETVQKSFKQFANVLWRKKFFFIFFLLIVCLIHLIFSLIKNEKAKLNNNIDEFFERPIEPLQEGFITPEEPGKFENSYKIYREEKQNWSDEELKDAVKIPDTEMMEQIHKMNTMTIDNILGEVP